MKKLIYNIIARLMALQPNSETDSLKVGQQAPDFSLSDESGNKYTLSQQLNESKVVLLFYRSGDW